MTLGGETDSSNPSRLIFSIKIPVNTSFEQLPKHKMNHRNLTCMKIQETGTNPAEALLFPELHMFLTRLEAHLWQGWFQLQPSVDRQFFPQSTTKSPALAYLRNRTNNYKHNNIKNYIWKNYRMQLHDDKRTRFEFEFGKL